MLKARFLIRPFGEKSPLVVLGLVLFLTTALSKVAPSQVTGADEQKKVARQVAQKWVQVGEEQYKRGFFKAAEQSFLRAQDYQEYLTAAEREKLEGVLEKTHIAVLERKRILEHIQTADKLVEQGELIKAKAHLEKVEDSEFLTEAERKQITEGLKKLDNQLSGQTKEIADLYKRSVELYRAGQLEKALEGFVKVAKSGLLVAPAGQTAGDYIRLIAAKIKTEAKPKKPEPKKPEPKKPEPKKPEPKPKKPPEVLVTFPEPNERAAVTGPVADVEVSYIDKVIRRRNIRRSYTRTVVNDAVAKAQGYISQGQFDRAKEVLGTAKRTVYENQLDLGDLLLKQYDSQLKGLTGEIILREKEMTEKIEQQKRQDAIKAARQREEQMEADRQKRIAELMENAMACQKQQRYEEALGQLESLLVLDPQNNNALILKQTLEDTVTFRKQLEVERERNKERADILRKTDEAAIPYAEDITYPKNWREIVAKPTRRPEEPIGLDPADIEVYKQLDETVDLSALTPEMPFSEAIEELKNSIEPPLKIIVLWRDLYDTADIRPDTAINMDGVPAIRLGTGLENLLKAVSGGFVDLDYVVQNGVITIATIESLPSKLVTRVYDVTDLLGQPAFFIGGGGMGGMGGMGGYGGGMGGYGGGMGGYGGGMGGYGGGMGGYGGGGYGGGGYGGGGYGGGGYGGGYGGMGGYGGGGYGGMGGGGYGGYGGGMGGYGGGMGGYGGGMGGYGGGMGGYGGGMGGYGGGMGGYGMGMGMGGGIDFRREYRGENLTILIEETIEPDSWWEAGGEGTITVYEGKKLIILQTLDTHKEIETLLDEMRKSLGHQVSIETRFLVVTENFLEEIGLDVDFRWNIGGKWGPLEFRQGSLGAVIPEVTKVPGSLAGISSALEIGGTGLNSYAGYGSILDDLMVTFLIKATQAHTDATTLTAPKLTVLSGETATFQIQRDISYALPPTVLGSGGGGVGGGYGPGYGSGYPGGSSSVLQNVQRIPAGTTLTITPTINPDKKYVLLNIMTYLQDLLRLKAHEVEAVIPGTGGAPTTRVPYRIEVPETERSSVQTRVSVPDGGTLLLGGQKITAELEKEAGVPVLSKIPLVGRLFSNRTKVRDHKILLILVKPTIILQEEREKEAIAAMESEI